MNSAAANLSRVVLIDAWHHPRVWRTHSGGVQASFRFVPDPRISDSPGELASRLLQDDVRARIQARIELRWAGSELGQILWNPVEVGASSMQALAPLEFWQVGRFAVVLAVAVFKGNWHRLGNVFGLF